MNPPGFKTRREFLRTGMLGGSLCRTVPAFLQNTMLSLHAAADGQLVQGVTGKDGHILVVLQLAGGNDGLIPDLILKILERELRTGLSPVIILHPFWS